ncbi:MAG: nuclear transport factor 2 family protein [Acidobacteria bacterium]|nr:nuclear transport factor 2 family protein [Acidobacteriota bacterium]MBA4122176.1 nuclear transport factor 2 family protein [Acidobacteriota bacterium]MBA4185593.1 nuclear transport factor 2 family protein [Acidobacteriota bacterium]
MIKKIIFVFVTFVVAGVLSSNFYPNVSAQMSEEKAVVEVLRQNATAFAKNDLATLDKVWANDEAVTVFENGHANYGWSDYRNNHLAPEMKEIKNTKYALSDIKVKIDSKTAWATFKYTISGDADGKHFDGGGLGTAILEKRGGRWQIVHWHSSAPRRAPSPSPTPKK